MFNIFQNIRGLVGTIIFHVLLAVILYFFGFSTPLPLPEEEGILVNFGNSEFGLGDVEPQFNEVQNTENKTEQQEIIESTSDEGYITQDMEEAPALKSSENVKTDNNNKADEQKRLEEQKRKEQEEIERKKREEEEKKRKQQEIDNIVSNAFAKGQNTEDNSSNSEGITKGDGNQGNESGSVNSDNYTNINSSGSGDVTFSLTGRNFLRLPIPEYNYQVEGKVVVEVTVDKNGKVTKAVPGVQGSSTLDENLLKAAKEAALNASFDTKLDAPAFQKGTITYYFRLQ